MKKCMLLVFVLLLSCFFGSRLEAVGTQCVFNQGSGQPSGIAADNLGNVWAAFFDGNFVVKLGPDCSRQLQVGLSSNPNGVAWDGTNVWVTLYGTNEVAKISSSGTVLATYGVGTHPRGVVFDGVDSVWVANSGSNSVSKININTGLINAPISVQSTPFFPAYNPANSTIWVPNSGSSSVTIIDRFTGVPVNTILTASTPQFIASDGFNMWVSCYNPQVVQEFSPSGMLVATYNITGHGQPLGVDAGQPGIINGVTHGGYLFQIFNGVVHYTFLGGREYDVVYDHVHNLIWITDITQGIVGALNP